MQEKDREAYLFGPNTESFPGLALTRPQAIIQGIKSNPGSTFYVSPARKLNWYNTDFNTDILDDIFEDIAQNHYEGVADGIYLSSDEYDEIRKSIDSAVRDVLHNHVGPQLGYEVIEDPTPIDFHTKYVVKISDNEDRTIFQQTINEYMGYLIPFGEMLTHPYWYITGQKQFTQLPSAVKDYIVIDPKSARDIIKKHIK